MARMRFLKRPVKVDNLEETRRLPVDRREPVFREKLPSEHHLENIREAREYLFQNTPQIKRITK